jgi:two-component system phosphate regulon sensor histidine kinase PhoR
MKDPSSRLRFMAVLMICSQLLLTGFVSYWLTGQYREEGDLLHEELKQEYMEVYDQLVDTMLMEHLVFPSLDDSILIKIHEKGSIQPHSWIDSGSAVVLREQQIGEPQLEIDLHSIHVDGSAPPDSGMQTIDVTSVISDEERMVKSVRLFISKNQEAFQMDSSMHLLALSPDSSSLMFHVEEALDLRGWTFSLDWTVEDAGPSEGQKKDGILLMGGTGSSLPAMRVDHYQAYLIRAILPQILFGLILLALSVSALLFAYRSLLRQLALSRLRDDFISNISHELKTPVSTVKLALEALRTFDQQKDPKVSDEYLEMAAKETDRLERMVEKVLHHQMLDAPALVLDKEHVHLGDLARSVVRSLDIPIRKKGARVVVSEKDGPCSVMGDRLYVEGMIMNLIDNSLKYSGDDPEILVKTECGTSGIRLSVCDNGPGIPEEYKDQVFEKFFRIPAGNRHNVKGYGLGLNFARQVMARHGGQIFFRNLPEGGCCFTLEFPLT